MPVPIQLSERSKVGISTPDPAGTFVATKSHDDTEGRPDWRKIGAACLLSVVLVAVTLWVRLLIGARVDGPVLVLFCIPIIVSAYLGGLWPGLTATIAACLSASYYLLPPLNRLTVASANECWQEGILLVAGACISAICEALRVARRRAEVNHVAAVRGQEDLRAALKANDDLRTAIDEHAIVAITDAQGKITFVNDRFCKISQYSREELLGQDHRIINASFHAKEFIRSLWSTIGRGKAWHGEIKNRAKDGTFYWVETTIVPFLDAKGKPRQYIAIRADITERKRAEEKVLELNAELEQRVTDRTAQLEAANHELEAFSYSVSHDLRAPLRAVDGFSQAVIDDFGPQLPADGQRMLQTIRQSAQRMGALIDDLLTFSRLSRQPLAKQLVNHNALVRAALEELGSPWRDRQVKIKCDALPSGQGDPALLKQVWLNLLGNALKYSRKRAPAVIEVGCTPGPTGAIYRVKDNGTGFDMRYANKLFGVFQRLHRMEDYEGTGVGLATVQRIVRRHGGRVWAESVLDQGATFYFTLEEENPTHE